MTAIGARLDAHARPDRDRRSRRDVDLRGGGRSRHQPRNDTLRERLADLDEARGRVVVQPRPRFRRRAACVLGRGRARGAAAPGAPRRRARVLPRRQRNHGDRVRRRSTKSSPAGSRPPTGATRRDRRRTTEPSARPPRDLPWPTDATRRAMMLYTSGTTGRPKGVVHTHGSVLEAQVESLIDAWAWSPADRILLVLPLHHVHGVVNVTLVRVVGRRSCAKRPADSTPAHTWERLASGEITLFMAVPTIYTRLIGGLGRSRRAANASAGRPARRAPGSWSRARPRCRYRRSRAGTRSPAMCCSSATA